MLAKGRAAPVSAAAVIPDARDTLSPEADLALAWCSPTVRAPLSIAFQLDRRLARIVQRTSEPMLGQMRLAWWRDALGKPLSERPRGDAVLDGIGVHWKGRDLSALVAMVDGWEVLVTAESLGSAEIASFGQLRGAFFAGLGKDGAGAERLAAAGFRWAVADAAASVSDAGERAALVAAGLAHGTGRGRMSRELRGLAVLDALATRALKRGGRPLMEGRGAPLAALRAAIFLS